MASGWWKSTHANLALGSPVDFVVTTGPKVPRGYPKIVNIATGAGLYLGGTPCVNIDDVIYYAGDDYTQDTEKPVLCRYDGRISTDVLEIPYITGSTPSKAILSLAVDTSDNIYISTWDSGTTATTFAGRVFKFDMAAGTIATFGDNIFSSGKLPYALAVQGTNLIVGTTAQDPTKHAFIYTIALADGPTTLDKVFQTGDISAPTISAVTPATATCTYKITTVESNGGESGSSAATANLTCDPVLDSTDKNTISWTAVTGAATYNVYRTAGHTTTGKIANTASTSFLDDGDAGDSASAPAAKTVAAPTAFSWNALGSQTVSTQYAATCTRGGNTSDATFSNTASGSTQGVSSNDHNLIITIADSDGATTVNIYRVAGSGTLGLIKSVASSVGSTTVNVFDNTVNGNGTFAAPAPSTPTSVKTGSSSTTASYRATANTAEGETTAGSTVSTSTSKATLTAASNVAVSWGAVGGATSYNLYRTAGHTSTGKIVNATGATSASDTGLAGSGSVPTANTSGDPVGGVGCMVVYSTDLYVGLYQEAGAFPTVNKRTTGGTWSVSDTIAPGGTARSYNGFTAGIVFESNLYMGYWNDDTTDLSLIRKFDGATWSTVKSISGAGARPFVAFCEADGNCWAYGGGDAVTGILYSSPTGATWTDQSALLPSSKEAIPFMGNTNVLGGF